LKQININSVINVDIDNWSLKNQLILLLLIFSQKSCSPLSQVLVQIQERLRNLREHLNLQLQ
jgi:hypothetical protein